VRTVCSAEGLKCRCAGSQRRPLWALRTASGQVTVLQTLCLRAEPGTVSALLSHVTVHTVRAFIHIRADYLAVLRKHLKLEVQ
jgi:hypothetical protein